VFGIVKTNNKENYFENNSVISFRKIVSGLGMSQKAYSYIENGKTKLNVEHLIKLSETLETDFLLNLVKNLSILKK